MSLFLLGKLSTRPTFASCALYSQFSTDMNPYFTYSDESYCRTNNCPGQAPSCYNTCSYGRQHWYCSSNDDRYRWGYCCSIYVCDNASACGGCSSASDCSGCGNCKHAVCNNGECGCADDGPTNSNWSDWGACDYSICSQSRTCENYPPLCGGVDNCTGDSSQHCGTTHGGWSGWGNCNANGNQTRTCSNPTPLCGGNECRRDDGTFTTPSDRTETRTCGFITGYIWDDRDYSNTFSPISPSEDWSRQPGCVDENRVKTFTLRASADDEDILSHTRGSWGCNGSTALYTSEQQIQRGERVISLTGGLPFSLPETDTLMQRVYDCNNVMWGFTNSRGESRNGTTCTMSSLPILPADGSASNNLNIRLRPVCEADNVYNLKVNVGYHGFEVPPGCPATVNKGPDGLKVYAHPESGVSREELLSGGSAVFSNLSLPGFINPKISIWANLVNKDDSEVYDTYKLVCPTTDIYQTDVNAKNCQVKTVDVDVIKIRRRGWMSAVDSDIFAESVNVMVPLGVGSSPTGFTKTLLNSFDNRTGGVLFSKGDLISPSENVAFNFNPDEFLNLLYEPNLGGRAVNLSIDHSGSEVRASHESKWLNNFSFDYPHSAEEAVLQDPNRDPTFDFLLTANFQPGKVYYTESSSLQEFLNEGYNYCINSQGVSILFVNGDITIKNVKGFNTTCPGRLLLVVDGSVSIEKQVGVDPLTLRITDDPHIELGIIASGPIDFESPGDDDDKAVMVSSPLISRTGISFSRDLGHDFNVKVPAESVKAFNKYLYLLTSLEREKSQENLYFTGVTTYDLDWEYIY